MHVDDLILVSVDDHLIEPPDVFANHVPARYKDLAPRVRKAVGEIAFRDVFGVALR